MIDKNKFKAMSSQLTEKRDLLQQRIDRINTISDNLEKLSPQHEVICKYYKRLDPAMASTEFGEQLSDFKSFTYHKIVSRILENPNTCFNPQRNKNVYETTSEGKVKQKNYDSMANSIRHWMNVQGLLKKYEHETIITTDYGRSRTIKHPIFELTAKGKSFKEDWEASYQA